MELEAVFKTRFRVMQSCPREIVPCRSRSGHLFWECAHLPLVQIREKTEFARDLWESCLYPDFTPDDDVT